MGASSSDGPGDHRKAPFAPGELLSDTYELLEDIGFGAMGQVTMAHDHRLNRRVAIKAAWTDENMGRLRAEAQALAAIKHPGLPTVHALDVHEGHEFMVMELIHGMGLDEHLAGMARAGEMIPVDQALEMLIAISDALSAVHGAGLVHRDVKPANILLTPTGRMVLIDFGLFVPQFERGKQDDLFGSPWYMAPELIRNRVEDGCWHLVDLYALGVVAFEVLTGRPPFAGVEVRDVFRAHVRAEVPDISEQRDDIPAGVAALIRELLAKSPQERPQSAESVREELCGLLSKVRASGGLFEVLIVSPKRSHARTLAARLRKIIPDIDVRYVARGEDLYEQVQRRTPEVALVGEDISDVHPMELVMFLRGSSRALSIGWLGEAHDAEEALLGRLRAERLPAIDAEDTEAIVKAVRAARRRYRRTHDRKQ